MQQLSVAKSDSDLHLLEHLSTAIICVSASLDVTRMNPAAESLLAISERKARELNLMDIVELPDSLLARMQESLIQDQPYTDRHVTLNLVGHDAIVVDCTITPRRDDTGNDSLLLEMTHIDRQLRIVREEALVSQQESSRSLLRGLAHEIKNPLGGLRGAAQLLERELVDASLKEYTSIIISESDRLQQLIDRMLGPANRPVMQLLNIHDPLEHVRKILAVECEPGIKLHIDYDPSIPDFSSDRDRLVQVFLNIAVNALHAVGAQGNITFRTRIVNNFTIGSTRHRLALVAEIIDDGKGISEELREQIFFPLVSDRSDGTGLGLSIAQTIVSQLDGLIECHSRPNQTTFTVYLPIVLPGQVSV